LSNEGGTKNFGTVYKLTLVTTGKKKGTWTEKLLYSFKGGTKDGSEANSGIVFDTAGNIYGTTTQGGKHGLGIVFELVAPVGTSKVYKEKVLLTFTGANGGQPYSSLILDSAGNLYGTTPEGGSNGYGCIRGDSVGVLINSLL